MGSTLVFASDGSFELRLDPRAEGVRFKPNHQGLVALAATLELLGGTVYTFPSLSEPAVTGLPEGYDARGFVETAITLSQMGWSSQPGGTA